MQSYFCAWKRYGVYHLFSMFRPERSCDSSYTLHPTWGSGVCGVLQNGDSKKILLWTKIIASLSWPVLSNFERLPFSTCKLHHLLSFIPCCLKTRFLSKRKKIRKAAPKMGPTGFYRKWRSKRKTMVQSIKVCMRPCPKLQPVKVGLVSDQWSTLTGRHF